MPVRAGRTHLRGTFTGKVGSWVIAALAVTVVGCASVGATSTANPPQVGPTPSATAAPSQGAAASVQPSSPGWYGGTLVWALSCPGIKPDGRAAWAGTAFATKIHELVLPDGYRVDGSRPFRLLGPDGEVLATEGDAIEVAGEIPVAVSSFCSIGPQLIVRELKVVDGK
jgi:hypothetical protein